MKKGRLVCRGDVYRGADGLGAVEVGLAYGAEGDNTLYEREDRVVLAEAYMLALEHLGAALAHDNVARLGLLAGIELNTEVFRL